MSTERPRAPAMESVLKGGMTYRRVPPAQIVVMRPSDIPFPEDIRDLESLNEWIARLPMPQVDVIGMAATVAPGGGSEEFHVLQFGRVVTREDDAPDERARAKRDVLRSLAMMIYGFALASPEGVVWRVRPEFEYQTDVITQNVMALVYARIGRMPRLAT